MAKKQKIGQIRAGELYDLLTNRDYTRDEILVITDWKEDQFREALQILRDALAGDDTITAVAEPNGARQPWIYGLRSGTQILDGETSKYIKIRISDIDRRLITFRGAIDISVRGTDGRTMKGKKARALQLHLKQAAEHFALIEAQGDDAP